MGGGAHRVVTPHPFNPANLLSGLRLAGMPLLLGFAWHGRLSAFLLALALLLLTDALDGFVARRYNWQSPLGTRLDSWGDLAIYTTLPLCAWWLFPEVVRAEWPFVLLVVLGYLLPLCVALLKFHTITSYHTWADKLAAVTLSLGVLLLFATGANALFRLGVGVLVLAALEEVAITLHLERRRDNIHSLWHLRRGR